MGVPGKCIEGDLVMGIQVNISEAINVSQFQVNVSEPI